MRNRSSVILRTALDTLYADFNVEHSAADPIWIVRRYDQPADREVAGFIAAALAFGRVQSVINSIEGMLAVMGPSPAAFVRAFDPARDRRAFDHLVHRWTQRRRHGRARLGAAPDDREERID